MPNFPCLPSDIYHSILLYYVIDFMDLIFLRTMNHEWKKIVESSLLWYQIPLTFYAPKIYLNHFLENSRSPNVNFYVYIKRITAEDRKGCLKYKSFESYKAVEEDFKTGLFLIECDNRQERKELINSINVNTKVNRFEQSSQISLWFLDLRREHYRRWNKQVKIITMVNTVREYLLHVTKSRLSYIYLLFGILDVTAGYGIYTLQQNLENDRKLHWENYLSFLCIDLIIILILLLDLAQFVILALSNFPYQWGINIPKLFFDMMNYHAKDMTALSILGTFIVMIMIEIGLTISNFPWISLIIPCLILLCYVLYRILSTWHRDASEVRRNKFYFALISILLISCFLLFLGLFLDGYIHTKYPLGIPILFLFPFFFLVIAAILMIMKESLTRLFCKKEFLVISPSLKSYDVTFLVFGSISLVLNGLLIFYAFRPDYSRNSSISFLPPFFVLYLYLNSGIISFYCLQIF